MLWQWLSRKGAISINSTGASNPHDEKAMNTELTCIKGFISKSFKDLVQMQVQGGYPIGEEGIEVESPFNSVLNQGAHGFSEHMHYLTTVAVNDAVTDMCVPPTG